MRLATAARFLAQKLLIERSDEAGSTALRGRDLLLLKQQQSVGLLHQRKKQHLPQAPPHPHAAVGDAAPPGENQPHDLFAEDPTGWNNGRVLRNKKQPPEENMLQQLCDPHSAEPDIGILSCGTLYYCAESQDSAIGGFCTPAAAAYTTSNRGLEDVLRRGFCNNDYSGCDCTHFDLATNMGSYVCEIDFCCQLDGTQICYELFRAGDVAAGSSSIHYCYDFTSPEEIRFCANFVGSECTITIDGVECNNCQVLDCNDLLLKNYGFDCTNIPESGRQGGCEDFVLPIVDDLVASDYCQAVTDSECGVIEVTAISGEPVTIPPCIDDVGKTTVTRWPQNGSLAVQENGSMVYVPNANFVGQDVIEVETCSSTGNCFEVIVNVEVVEQPSPEGDGGGSGGTAALVALAVIPVAGIGFWMYKKKQSNSGDSQGHLSGPSFKEGASVNVSTVNQSVDGPSVPTYEEAREPQQMQQQQQQQQDQAPQQAGRQSVRQSGGGGMPTVKDQAQSVDGPASITASVQSDGDGRASAASRQRQDPPSDPPAASPTATAKPMANAASQGYMPDVKDQCRNVPQEEMDANPPLAAAIILEDPVILEDTVDSA